MDSNQPLSADDEAPSSGRRALSTERKVQIGFALALALLIMIIVVSLLSVITLTNNAAQVGHTYAVSNDLDRLLLAATEAETAQRGFIIAADPAFSAAYAVARREAEETLSRLQSLTHDNREQQRRLQTLRPLLNERMELSAARIELRRTQGFNAVRQLAAGGAGQRLQNRLRATIAEARRVELSLLLQREAAIRRSTLITKTIIIGGGLLAVLLVGLSLVLIRRDTRARRAAEAQLDRFFSLSLDFLCISSADGYFKRVSPAVTDILGWSVREFLDRPYLDFVHPDDVPATIREVERQIRSGEKVMRFDNRYRHKDGSWRILSWRSAPQPDGLMYATARDVTDMRNHEDSLRQARDELDVRVRERTSELAQANESLRRSERRFRALIEHGGDAMTLVDRDNKVLYLSPAVAAVEGYAPEELIGGSGIREVHPDDLHLVDALRRKLAASPGKPFHAQWRLRHKLGHWIWLDGHSTNLLHDPDVRAVVANYRNVTERKEADNKLQAQLARLALLSEITRAIGEHQDTSSIFQVVVGTLEEQLPVDFACLCRYQPETRLLTVSNVGTSRPELLTRLALHVGVTIEVGATDLDRCLSGVLVYEPDVAGIGNTFTSRFEQAGLRALVAAPLLTEKTAFGVLLTARSEASSFSSGECEFLRQLSEHVSLAAHQSQLHESLQAAYQELRQTQQAVMEQERMRVLGQMASGIAHDINNAISPISLYTESLLESEPHLSAQGTRQLQTIRRAIEDVAETVDRMREFYRQRETEVHLAPLQLNTLVPQVVELTRARWSDMPQLRGSVIGLTMELAANLPLIMGVESEIREALTNLIFNAVDALPQGGNLVLRTSIDNAAGSRVRVDVSDTGIGMNDETRRRCLELFFTTKGERGTGLGLAMVYGIMQRHAGEITIESSPGNGTTVSLLFSMAVAAAPVVTALLATPRAGLRILVIDDDQIILESMQLVLQNDGFVVATATGGQQGIDAFTAAIEDDHRFDIVITDLGMPSVDGRKVSTAIKTLSPDTPIIMLTGWGQRMVSDGDTPANVDKVLSKPPKPRELRAVIAELTTASPDKRGRLAR